MPLDPQARMILDVIASLDVPELGTVPVEQSRQENAKRRAAMPPGPEADVSDHHAAGALLRLYKPKGATGVLPALLWMHGGGFVLGSVQEGDAECRHLVDLAGCAVISVDYPLAPEHPYPAATDTCYAALQWVHAHARELGIDPARIAVGGDSAGGNLATSIALTARDRGGPKLAYQVLVYPVTDLSRFDRASYLENADGYFLTRESMMWFADQYVPRDADRVRSEVSPLLANDLTGLPPALVITAEYDPLRDEGAEYAARLARAGVDVTHSEYPGLIHGFFSMHTYLDGGKRVLHEVAQALKQRL